MAAPRSMPRPAPSRRGPRIAALAGLAVFAVALAAASVAGAQSRRTDRESPADPGKPAFFVDWAARGAPPGLTARPERAKSDALPAYPAESARRKETGTTALTVCVTTEGRLVDVRLARSSGYARLDQAALAWARSAKFTPAAINGDPVNVCGYALDYAWRLDQ